MTVSTRDDVQAMLERMLVHGIKPYPDQLRELGLDRKYLEIVLGKLRHRIALLPSYQPIKGSLRNYDISEKKQIFSEASWADVPSLRLVNKRESFSGGNRYNPLITLCTNAEMCWSSDTRFLEVFVTSNCEWIVCDSAKMRDKNFAPIICRTIEELDACFIELQDAGFWLYPNIDSIFVTIANWLMKVCRDEIYRLQQYIGYLEASVAECDVVRERFGYNTR